MEHELQKLEPLIIERQNDIEIEEILRIQINNSNYG